MAEAEVRINFDGPAVAGQAQEKMRKYGAWPDIDSAAAGGAPRASERKGNDHVSRPDYPNLDHLELVGKQSIKKDGQRRRVQDDQRSHSSAEELKIAMLAPPWIPIPPPRYGG